MQLSDIFIPPYHPLPNAIWVSPAHKADVSDHTSSRNAGRLHIEMFSRGMCPGKVRDQTLLLTCVLWLLPFVHCPAQLCVGTCSARLDSTWQKSLIFCSISYSDTLHSERSCHCHHPFWVDCRHALYPVTFLDSTCPSTPAHCSTGEHLDYTALLWAAI